MKPYKFNPIKDLNLDIPRNKRKDALEAAADLIKTEMLDYIGEGKSPVSGFGKFPGYSKNYKTFKKDHSSSSTVNLELTGEMLDALTVENIGSNINVYINGDEKLQGKAEGNNIGTYGTSRTIEGKVRRFIPLDGEKFKRDILSKLRDLLSDYEE